GEFGGVEAIATAKGELVEALAPDGRAVLNTEDRLDAATAERSAAPLATWRFTPGYVRGGELALDEPARASLTPEVHQGLTTLAGEPVGPESFPVRPDLLGEHQAANALAALTAALVAGVDPVSAAAALEGVTLASAQRMQALHAGGALIIDDAYNA